jgi:hypothetical protein
MAEDLTQLHGDYRRLEVIGGELANVMAHRSFNNGENGRKGGKIQNLNL